MPGKATLTTCVPPRPDPSASMGNCNRLKANGHTSIAQTPLQSSGHQLVCICICILTIFSCRHEKNIRHEETSLDTTWNPPITPIQAYPRPAMCFSQDFFQIQLIVTLGSGMFFSMWAWGSTPQILQFRHTHIKNIPGMKNNAEAMQYSSCKASKTEQTSINTHFPGWPRI